jgi:autoinducer 2-degrading protein
MIVLVAKYTCKPGNRPKVLEQLKKIAPLVAASEPGCKFYQASISTENENLILLYEHYVDQAALAAHRETPHFKEIIEGTVIPMLDNRARELYELAVS